MELPRCRLTRKFGGQRSSCRPWFLNKHAPAQGMQPVEGPHTKSVVCGLGGRGNSNRVKVNTRKHVKSSTDESRYVLFSCDEGCI